MRFHPSLPAPQPLHDARAFMPDADACVDELLALAEWLRDRQADGALGDHDEDAAS